jgi:hypothetical protein
MIDHKLMVRVILFKVFAQLILDINGDKEKHTEEAPTGIC